MIRFVPKKSTINLTKDDYKKGVSKEIIDWYSEGYAKRVEELLHVLLYGRVRSPNKFAKRSIGRYCHSELSKVLDHYNDGIGADALNEYKFTRIKVLEKGHRICSINPGEEDFESSNFFEKSILSVLFLYNNRYSFLKGIYICNVDKFPVFFNILEKAYYIAYNRPHLIDDVYLVNGMGPLVIIRKPDNIYKNNNFSFGIGILEFMHRI